MKRPYYDLEASGERMKEIRKCRNLSVKDVVAFMGFESTQAIYKWESGKCLPQADNLLALSILYRVSPMELLVEDGQVPSLSVFREDLIILIRHIKKEIVRLYDFFLKCDKYIE